MKQRIVFPPPTNKFALFERVRFVTISGHIYSHIDLFLSNPILIFRVKYEAPEYHGVASHSQSRHTVTTDGEFA